MQAHSLPKMDDTTFSKFDLNAYMSMSWQNCKMTTEVVNRKVGDKAVVFNEMLNFGL